MNKHTNKLVESTPFMVFVTALGGFCNAYTGMTRGGVFANAHTANMAKLGLSVALLDWNGAFNALVPIFGCLLGIIVCEHVQAKAGGNSGEFAHEWLHRALMLELAALFIVGFVPSTVPHAIVNAFMSFVTGFQLDLFRKWWGGGHNTTICTGNLRNLGQYIYAAAHKDAKAREKVLPYALLVISFAIGAFFSTLFCLWMGVKASWAGCFLIAGLIVWMYLSEAHTAKCAL